MMRKIYHAVSKQKRAGVASTNVRKKTDFKAKSVTRDKEGHS